MPEAPVRIATLQILFNTLHQMDAESQSVTGKGLQWYAGLRHQSRIKNRWLRELRRRLAIHNIEAVTNVPYSADSASMLCDLVVRAPDEPELWLEVLGIWKEYSRRIGMPRSYRSALFHPRVPGLEKRTNSAPHCLERVQALTPPAAAGGLLLIGFDAEDAPLNPEVDELIQLCQLREPQWTLKVDQWPSDHPRTPQRVGLWAWVRNAPSHPVS